MVKAASFDRGGGVGNRGPSEKGADSWGTSQRQRRVAEELRHVLARILASGECRDPALRDANITVTEVRMSPDLRNATVYVMPLGGANALEVAMALTRSAGFLRGQVTRQLTLRFAPNLVFELDQTFDQADRITALLARPEVERDLLPHSSKDKVRDAG
ncbi:MAG: 30S ribosome-binding factor RbfA [Alphaproteobacteria bacterium]|nr:30S ribosome-binding factor RbfA [Alphaproteobacteria bacterium]